MQRQVVPLRSRPTIASINTLDHQDEWGRYTAEDGTVYLFRTIDGSGFSQPGEYRFKGFIYNEEGDKSSEQPVELILDARGLRDTVSARLEIIDS